jgi:uncharacterized protein with NRDE domain
MCVLTYLPLGNDDYILTNNRDENPKRPSSLKPKSYDIHGQKITFPKDPLGGGTWIATSHKRSVVLLNGGHTIHKHNPPYRQSRGMVILDYFQFDSEVQFFEQYNFNGIEPFTLVIVGEQIMEIRWDENGKTLSRYSREEPKIWSSVTLYTPAIIAKREQWFQDFLAQNKNVNQNTILDFHKNGGDGDKANSLKMERGEEVKTLGISQIISKNKSLSLSYFALH